MVRVRWASGFCGNQVLGVDGCGRSNTRARGWDRDGFLVKEGEPIRCINGIFLGMKDHRVIWILKWLVH